MKRIIILLVLITGPFALSFASSPAPTEIESQFQHQAVQKVKHKKSLKRKIKDLKDDRTKGKRFLNISIGFSLLTTLASLVLPSSLGWDL